PPTPSTPSNPPTPSAPAAMEFDFYGIPVEVPKVDLNITARLLEPADFGKRWRELNKVTALSSDIAPALQARAQEMGLNDYLTFELARQWVNAVAPSAHESSRLSLTHYMAALMGFDVRLAQDTRGVTLLLIPFEQQVYARPYLVFDDKNFYVFADDGVDVLNGLAGIKTCKMPEGADCGRVMDLRLAPLTLPDDPREFTITDGRLKITGQVNNNLQKMLLRYPQSVMATYASSDLQPALRNDIVEQLKAQTAKMSTKDAVNALLSFVQNGFEYATDDENHGFEKPYFFEEMLLYDKCDCEDRAVFYTYLLWNVLGVHSHLLHYPGHESASVTSAEANFRGDHYDWKKATYYISDPTFIGAFTGMCMPQYTHTPPEIDYVY
ncbi:MAG: hypothetical protein LIP02_02585, partial [Bacteroidales bacterium]|nr:hypothetical protein [Bacteroidales bacterium]